MEGASMFGMNLVAALVAAVAAFVVSAAWYVGFDQQVVRLRGPDAGGSAGGKTPAWKMLVELGRSLVVALVLGRLVVLLDVNDAPTAAHLGIWLWTGFPLTLLAGSVIWERVPWKLAAIHAGDWLVKVLLMAGIVAAWR
jgi:hypothetical protein